MLTYLALNASVKIVMIIPVHFFCGRKHATTISRRTLYYLCSFAYRFYGGINLVRILRRLWFGDALLFILDF